MSHSLTWHVRDRLLDLGERPLVMGIVNVTPDSFSDGGQFLTTESAVEHGLRLIEGGADILDLGGESSRPGAEPVSLEEELRRVVPVVERLAGRCLLSVDTYKAEVARRCLEAGAEIINDITALGRNFEDRPEEVHEAMAEVAAEYRAGLILMHMRGKPTTMQIAPRYEDPVGEIIQYFEERFRALESRGLDRARFVMDPGIGFGKLDPHIHALLTETERFADLGRPLCLGVSRKGFLGRLLGPDRQRRDAGTLAVQCHAMGRGVAHIFRVHNVRDAKVAVEVYQALRSNEGETCSAKG